MSYHQESRAERLAWDIATFVFLIVLPFVVGVCAERPH